MTKIDPASALLRAIKDARKIGTHSDKDASLHHVFIQAEKSPIPVDDEVPAMPIKQAFLDNIADTASRYPNMPISIWVDFYGRGNNSSALMDKLNEQAPAPNVTFKSLDEAFGCLDNKIAVSVNKIFERQHTTFEEPSSPIWQQVDLARAIVLQHVLEDPSNPRHAIYADMDVIIDPEIFKKLDDHGIVSARNDMPNSVQISYKIENRIVGMATDFLPFLKDDLIPRMIALTEKYNLNGWHGHIASFARSPQIRQATAGDVNQILFYPQTIDDDQEIKKSYQKDAEEPDDIKELKAQWRQALKDSDIPEVSRLHGVIMEKQQAYDDLKTASASDKANGVSGPQNNGGMT